MRWPKLFERLKHPTAAFIHDVLMVPVAWLGAFWLRFNLEEIPSPHWETAIIVTPLVMLAQAGVFWYFGLYRGVWRFASIPDLLRIAKAIVVGVLVAAVVVFLTRVLASRSNHRHSNRCAVLRAVILLCYGY